MEVEVEMQLQQKPDGSTVIRIIEKEMDNNDAGITWLKGNTEGWANFLACLKAYMEYGINLRKGAFGVPGGRRGSESRLSRACGVSEVCGRRLAA